MPPPMGYNTSYDPARAPHWRARPSPHVFLRWRCNYDAALSPIVDPAFRVDRCHVRPRPSGRRLAGLCGPNRDGICRETGLLKEWPKEGPKLLWKAKGLGIGFSGPALVGNVLYIMGGIDNNECVLALDVSQGGKQLWNSVIGPIRNGGAGYPGPRSTPTIDGDRLYTLGIAGDLVCMDIKDGRILWHRDLVKDVSGGIPNWGYSESVLIDGPWLICTPGGKKNTIAALDKTTGDLVWGSPVGDSAGPLR